MSIEISVRMKNEEKTLKKEFLEYSTEKQIMCSLDDPTLQAMVNETRKEFNAEPDDTSVKIEVIGW